MSDRTAKLRGRGEEGREGEGRRSPWGVSWWVLSAGRGWIAGKNPRGYCPQLVPALPSIRCYDMH